MVIDADKTARQHLISVLLDVDRQLDIRPCENAISAQRFLSERVFDLCFLDVDLPGTSGFGFLDEQQKYQRQIPPLVFTITHQDFAFKAFDYPVVDYLLKPLTTKRVAKTLNKLDNKSNHNNHAFDTKGSIPSVPEQPYKDIQRSDPNRLIQFKHGSNLLCLRHADILWIEAAGDYMCLHTLTETHILRTTLARLEQQLNTQYFVRVNRSALVNWHNVIDYKSVENGNYRLRLINQIVLRVSRKYQMRISQRPLGVDV